MDAWMCMAEALCCPPVTIMMLLISYTPIQNTAFKKEQGDQNFPHKVVINIPILSGLELETDVG